MAKQKYKPKDNNKGTNFPSKYTENNRVKLKKMRPKPKDDGVEKLNQKFSKLQSEFETTNLNPLETLNEQYAHDLIAVTILFRIADTHIKAKKAEELERLQKILEKEKKADANFEQNMNNYDDFRTNSKFLKIIETKKQHTENKLELDKLNSDEEKVKAKLVQTAKKFDFKNEETGSSLSFETPVQVEKFLDTMEKSYTENSYRMKIEDSEEIAIIAKTKVGDLFSLAQKTQENRNAHNSLMIDADIGSKAELTKAAADAVTVASPTKLALG